MSHTEFTELCKKANRITDAFKRIGYMPNPSLAPNAKICFHRWDDKRNSFTQDFDDIRFESYEEAENWLKLNNVAY